jgi:hypothetical protein
MHISLGQALVGLLATCVPAALATPVEIYDSSDFNNTTIPTATTASPILDERSLAAWPASPSNLKCYNQMKGCKNKDVHLEKAREYGENVCDHKRFRNLKAKPGWLGEYGYVRNRFWLSYNVKVEWKEGCTAPGDGTQDVRNPGHGVECFDLIWTAWKNCKGNGGRGGSVEFGCLTYHFNVINGKEVGDGYCVDIPFGNWTR